MRTIMVDDEIWMLARFEDECAQISDIELVGKFQSPFEALEYAKNNRVDLAFLDIMMPQMTGIELALELRKFYPEIIIIFVSAHEQYMPEAFRTHTADYYVLKPYRKKDVEEVLERVKLLSGRLRKKIYVKTFGRFGVLVNGQPIPLSGKAKEILALLVSRRGKSISNEEAYDIVWEGREYSHEHMKVYHNALKRLKTTLEAAGISDLLVSGIHAHMADTSLFDCDYYNYLDGKATIQEHFDGEFMSEYSWGEDILAKLMKM